MDLIMAMRSDEASQAAFQFDLGKQAEVVCLEDIERNRERPYAQIHRLQEPQEKIYDQVPCREDTPEGVHQLLEAVQGVHQAVSDHSGGEQQPPLPPYPDLGNLSINQDKKKMAKVSNGSALSSSLPSSEPAIRVFSDDELSEIFQIDFGQIFGNPELGLKSSYRGIQSKRGVSRSNSAAAVPSAAATFSPLPPPEQFQSSPALARRPTPQAAGALSLRDGGSDQQSLHQSHSSSAIAHQCKSNSVQKSQSYSQQQSFSSQQTFSSKQSSSFQTSNVTTAHKQVVDSPAPPPAPSSL